MTTGFQCNGCGKWHDELPLDLGYAEPVYVAGMNEEERQQYVTSLGDFRVIRCNGETSRYVRGVIEIPIIGMDDVFRYGVWASLSEAGFEAARAAYKQDVAAGPFFGWLSNRVDGYPDTLNLKTEVHVRTKLKPWIELEPTKHPLAIEQRDGITIERVREIVDRALHPATQD